MVHTASMHDSHFGGRMKFTILITIATLSFSLSLWAQEPGDETDSYTNPNECLDDVMGILGSSYKVLNKDIIVHIDPKDGTLDVYRSNYKISKALPDGKCFDDSKHMLRGYNTVLINAYTKAKKQCTLAEKKAGPGNPINSKSCDAMVACDNQNKANPSDWYNEATKLMPNLKRGEPPPSGQ